MNVGINDYAKERIYKIFIFKFGLHLPAVVLLRLLCCVRQIQAVLAPRRTVPWDGRRAQKATCTPCCRWWRTAVSFSPVLTAGFTPPEVTWLHMQSD